MNYNNLFTLKLKGSRVAITTGQLFCYQRFGAVRVFSVWIFTISDIGDKFPIGGI